MMMNKVSVSDPRIELLFAIKNRVSEITSGELEKPVYFNDVIVNGPEDCFENGCNRVHLSSIFCTVDNILCGDLLTAEKRSKNTIMFGRDIEELSAGDLNKILNFLYTDKWAVPDDNLYVSKPAKKGGIFFSRLFRMHWFFSL